MISNLPFDSDIKDMLRDGVFNKAPTVADMIIYAKRAALELGATDVVRLSEKIQVLIREANKGLLVAITKKGPVNRLVLLQSAWKSYREALDLSSYEYSAWVYKTPEISPEVQDKLKKGIAALKSAWALLQGIKNDYVNRLHTEEQQARVRNVLIKAVSKLKEEMQNKNKVQRLTRGRSEEERMSIRFNLSLALGRIDFLLQRFDHTPFVAQDDVRNDLKAILFNVENIARNSPAGAALVQTVKRLASFAETRYS